MSKSIIRITAFLFFCNSLYIQAQKMIVCEPVINLTRVFNPENICNFSLCSADENPDQMSQLLLGEMVETLDNFGLKWVKVQCLEQTIYDKSGTALPLSGWVEAGRLAAVDEFPNYTATVKPASKLWAQIYNLDENKTVDVSIGTKLSGKFINQKYFHVDLPNNRTGVIKAENINDLSKSQCENNLRIAIVKTAKQFLNTSYSSGGRSGYSFEYVETQTGVDHDGFINLVYRTNGIDIPRYAKDQYTACKKISSGALHPGDLIFLAKKPIPRKINHVLLYLGNDLLIECLYKQSVFKVRTIKTSDRLGKLHSFIAPGECVTDKFGEKNYIYFGSIIANELSATHRICKDSKITPPNKKLKSSNNGTNL